MHTLKECGKAQVLKKVKSLFDYLFAANAVCILCGEEAHNSELGICPNCAAALMIPETLSVVLSENVYLDDICAAYAYTEPVAHGIMRLKYNGEKYLAAEFAKLMDIKNEWRIDAATAVPMYKNKLRKRGYNQSDALAEKLCERFGIYYDPGILRRTKATSSQVGTSRSERLNRQKDSFEADEKLCKGKNILLIDDVCTTGSTVNECAKELKKKGAERVYVSVFAHGRQ